MLDLEKILVKIVLALVALLFIVLLFNSCKSHKDIVKTAIDSTATEVVKVESHTTDNSTTQEDYTEITYVLDSGQIVSFSDKLGNSEQVVLNVREIKVKNSHVTSENKINNKIYATEEKTAEIKEKIVEKTKEKPITKKIVVLSLFSLLIAFIVYLFVKIRH